MNTIELIKGFFNPKENVLLNSKYFVAHLIIEIIFLGLLVVLITGMFTGAEETDGHKVLLLVVWFLFGISFAIKNESDIVYVIYVYDINKNILADEAFIVANKSAKDIIYSKIYDHETITVAEMFMWEAIGGGGLTNFMETAVPSCDDEYFIDEDLTRRVIGVTRTFRNEPNWFMKKIMDPIHNKYLA